MTKRSPSRRGRPRAPGDRFPGGKLRPPAPNEKVVALRRQMLGAGPNDKVDLSKAENALDVALARGWMSEPHHRAARRYTELCRSAIVTTMGGLPSVKVSQAPISRFMGLATEEEGPLRSGVITEADRKLAAAINDFHDGKISERQMSLAEKAHRQAKVDWSRLPDAEIARVFDAALNGYSNVAPAGPDATEQALAQSARRMATLRDIWSRLGREEIQELFEVTVLGSWPFWVIQRAAGHFSTSWERKRVLLERALDAVVEVLGDPESKRSASATTAVRLQEGFEPVPLPYRGVGGFNPRP